jgi:hypothetical protein
VTIRKLFLVEQPSGGYLAYVDEEIVDFGYGAAVFEKKTLEHLVQSAAQEWEGPTEIYWHTKPMYVTTVEGRQSAKGSSLAIGNRVIQAQGDSRVGGVVVQLKFDNIPRIDGDGNPVLGVLADDGEISETLENWQRVR